MKNPYKILHGLDLMLYKAVALCHNVAADLGMGRTCTILVRYADNRWPVADTDTYTTF